MHRIRLTDLGELVHRNPLPPSCHPRPAHHHPHRHRLTQCTVVNRDMYSAAPAVTHYYHTGYGSLTSTYQGRVVGRGPTTERASCRATRSAQRGRIHFGNTYERWCHILIGWRVATPTTTRSNRPVSTLLVSSLRVLEFKVAMADHHEWNHVSDRKLG